MDPLVVKTLEYENTVMDVFDRIVDLVNISDTGITYSRKEGFRIDNR